MIEFIQLVKKFGTKTVLNGISFRVETGEIVFILGTSGTGKSVLLKNLVGLLRSDSGEIWVNDENIAQFSEDQFLRIRRQVGLVFQQPALFDSLTVFENVAFGLRRHFQLGLPLADRWSDERIQQQVERCLGLVHVAVRDFAKLPAQISYGTQKRVSLARTLALEPKTLLFDEPTTGLDPVTTQAVNKLIQELSRKLQTTALVVSHDMECALAIADRIVVLDQGLVVAIGTPAEMRRSSVRLVQEFLSEAQAQEVQGGLR